MPTDPNDITQGEVVATTTGTDLLVGLRNSDPDAPLGRFPASLFASAADMQAANDLLAAQDALITAQVAQIASLTAQVDLIQGIIDAGGLAPLPTLITPPSFTAPIQGQLTTATPGVYDGAPAITSYWVLDGAVVPGANSTTFTPASGGDLAYREVATLGGPNLVTDTAEQAIAPPYVAPSVVDITIAPASVTVGDVLTASYSVIGNPAPTIALQWFLDGVEVGGETAATYTTDTVGDVTVRITASSVAGPDSVEISEISSVNAVPIAPIIDQVTLDPVSGLVGTAFTASVTYSNSPTPTPTLAYRWLLDGVEIVGATGVNYTAQNAGDLTVEITSENSAGNDLGVSAAAPVSLSQPVTTRLDRTTAQPGEHVRAWLRDPDGDETLTGNETYQWYEDGVAISGATWHTYVVRETHISDRILTCRASDPVRGQAMSLGLTVTDGDTYSSGAATNDAERLAQFNALPLFGGTVWLAEGAEFGDWVPPSRLFTGPCVFRSVNPDNPAIWRGFRLSNTCHNIIVRDVKQEFIPQTDSSATTFLNLVYGACQRVTFLDCEHSGGLNVNPDLTLYDGYNVGRMLSVGAGAQDVAAIGCEFHTMSGGLFALSNETTRLTIEECTSYHMSGDAYQFWAVNFLRFKGNIVRDALANQVDPLADHVDGLQFANAAGSRGNSNVWIEDNIMHSGDSANSWFQSFFLSAETSVARRHSNVTLINNLAYNAHKWGFRLIACDGGLFKNNTAIRNWDQTNISPDIEFWIQDCTNITLEKNVAQNYNIENGNTNITLIDNYTYVPAAEGFQAEFAGGLVGGSTMAQLQPQGALLAGGYGARYSAVDLADSGATVTQPLAMDDLPYDRMVFNSLNDVSAIVKLRGQGTTGDVIQIRGESAGGDTSWSTGVTVDSEGNWTATLSVPKAQWDEWYTPVARIGTDDLTKISGTNDFGCGYTIMVTGQSEAEHWLNQLSTYSGTNMPAPTGVVDENAVFILMRDDTQANIKAVPHTTYTYSNNVTPSKSCMFLAKMLSEGAPGVKFAIGDGAVPGTGRRDFFSDADLNNETTNNRDFSNYEAIANLMTGGSRRAGLNLTEVGHMLDAAWYTNDASPLTGFGWDQYIPGYFGQTVAGGTFPQGGVEPLSGADVDHFLWDLTGLNRGLFSTNTKWHITPPNNYNNYDADLQNSLFYATGTTNFRIGYRGHFDGLKALHESARVTAIRGVVGPSPHIYRSGTWNGSTWTNAIHPDTDSAYGAPYLAMHMGITMLKAVGVDYKLPTITDVTVPAGGATAVVKISLPNGGDLSTGRIVNGLADPSPDPAHRQPAHGFEILRSGDGLVDLTPLGFTAEITNTGTGTGAARYGEVTITPTVAFAAGDTIHYARGGAYGVLDYQDENAALVQLDMLIETVAGLTEYDGIPVEARLADLDASPGAGASTTVLTRNVDDSVTVTSIENPADLVLTRNPDGSVTVEDA